MKIKTFLRICFGSLGLGMTLYNILLSIDVFKISLFWGLLTFVGFELCLLLMMLIGYWSVTRNRNLEEEL